MEKEKFLELLAARNAATQAELEKVNAELEKLQVKKNMLLQEAFGWHQALESERRRSGGKSAAAAPAKAENAAASPTTINKTEMIKKTIIEKGTQGISAVELWNEVRTKAKFHRNYLYAVLMRLKERGEITERRGRLFGNTSVTQEGTQQALLQ